jgi:DNA-binding MarR family transcriptional regulator
MGQSISGEFRRRRRLELVAGGSHGLTDAQRMVLRSDAARIRYSRQLRHKLFGSAMFAETAWDILLTLYLADGELPRPEVRDLAQSTGSPLSTASRWLAYLEDEGLAGSPGHGREGHSGGVELTKKGRILLDEYFLELREAEIASPQSGTGDPSAI